MGRLRAKLAAAGALLFLLFVAAGARAAGVPGAPGGAGGLGVPGWAGSAVLALVTGAGTWLVYGALAALLASLGPRRRLSVGRSSWWAWLVEAAVAAAVVGLAVGLAYLLLAHAKARHSTASTLGPGAPLAPVALGHFRGGPGPSAGWLPLASGAAVALLALAVYHFARRRGPVRARMEGRGTKGEAALRQKRRQAAAALQLSLDALWAEPDPRKAVIAAYAYMDSWLARAGFARRPSEAAFEHLDRVMVGLGATAAAGARLAGLFERAKFDRRPCGPEMKQEALEALVKLRDELSAPRGGLTPA